MDLLLLWGFRRQLGGSGDGGVCDEHQPAAGEKALANLSACVGLLGGRSATQLRGVERPGGGMAGKWRGSLGRVLHRCGGRGSSSNQGARDQQTAILEQLSSTAPGAELGGACSPRTGGGCSQSPGGSASCDFCPPDTTGQIGVALPRSSSQHPRPSTSGFPSSPGRLPDGPSWQTSGVPPLRCLCHHGSWSSTQPPSPRCWTRRSLPHRRPVIGGQPPDGNGRTSMGPLGYSGLGSPAAPVRVHQPGRVHLVAALINDELRRRSGWRRRSSPRPKPRPRPRVREGSRPKKGPEIAAPRMVDVETSLPTLAWLESWCGYLERSELPLARYFRSTFYFFEEASKAVGK